MTDPDRPEAPAAPAAPATNGADRTTAGHRPGTGPKSRLLTLDDLDRRTKAAQRAFDLHDRLVAERGGAESMSVLRYSMTRSVAVLSAMVEDMQVKWLRGERVEPAAIATLLNARRREAEIVGIDPLPKDVTPDLKTYLDARSEPPGEADDAV
jgi:hypothetical protein